MAQVTEQRAVRFVQRQAPPYALGVVGLGDVQRDHARAVAGEDLLPRLVGKEFEDRPVALAIRRFDRRQAHLGQRVEEPALR